MVAFLIGSALDFRSPILSFSSLPFFLSAQVCKDLLLSQYLEELHHGYSARFRESNDHIAFRRLSFHVLDKITEELHLSLKRMAIELDLYKPSDRVQAPPFNNADIFSSIRRSTKSSNSHTRQVGLMRIVTPYSRGAS